MKIQSYTITFCLLFLSGFLYSQQSKEAIANSKYNQMSYVEAITLYTNLVNDGYGSAQLFENLGNAYYYQSNYKLAKVSYDSLYKKTDDFSLSTYYRYLNVLRSEKKALEADNLYSKLISKFPEEQQKGNLTNHRFLSPDELNLETIVLKNSKINSSYSDYKVSYLGDDKIVFSSSKDTKKLISIKSIWNNEAYTNLYESSIDGDTLTGEVSKLKGSINKFYNESSAVFTKDGQTMFFTRNDHLGNKVKTDSLDNMLLKIYKATFDGKRWGNIEELPFNSSQYNCAHPALSPKEDYLYFSSDMPGTIGDSDIFRVAIKDTVYGLPEHLGHSINSRGRDTFPFITSENVLIFASDFRKGLGGLDLYYVDLNSTSQKVYTFSSPINSSYDDFGLIYNESEGTGFLTSNRMEDNNGSDDIYEFTGFHIPTLNDLTLTVKASHGNEVLGNTEVTLSNEHEKLATVKVVNSQVAFIGLEPAMTYKLEVNNTHYDSYTASIKVDKTISKTIYLSEKAPEPVAVDLNEILQLKNIYFDFDKYAIRKDAAIELEKILEILNKYPKIKIEIIGHTDSRGPIAYNEMLSTKRAEATKSWLVSKGIAADRITALGLGMKTPINDCVTKNCTKEEFDQNRRTEFLIKQ